MADQPKVIFPPTFAALLELIATLRSEKGCPWDRKQTPTSLTVYLIEEAFELVEAITADNTADIQEEMGDVLFQILFLMQLYQKEGRFSPTDVLEQNLRKMVTRHPHVFGSDQVDSVAQVKQRWREIKQQEKGDQTGSLMDSVPSGLPALIRAYRVSERAAGIGFDWETLSAVMTQSEAEWDEFKAELTPENGGQVKDMAKATEEFGDALFTMVNVARIAGIHPETALSQATQKFIHRFKQMEVMAADQGKALKELPRDRMEALWVAAKKKKPALRPV